MASFEAKRLESASNRVPCSHRGAQPVKVGPYFIYLGGINYLEQGDLDNIDVLVPLTEVPLEFGKTYTRWSKNGGKMHPQMPPLTPERLYVILAAPMMDFSAPPPEWKSFLTDKLIPLLASGKTVLAFCLGSHGRTGTLLASLIALLEPDVADPIAEARARHCYKAVETREQTEAVMALRNNHDV